jgi:hypothetical protein
MSRTESSGDVLGGPPSRVAGAQPITWLGMAGELQRDGARTERLGAVAQILFDHAGASGTVLAWELENDAQRADRHAHASPDLRHDLMRFQP